MSTPPVTNAHEDIAHAGRGVHDIGGDPAGPVRPTDHEREGWEQRTDAMAAIARRRGVVSLDELRRQIESLGDAYHAHAYGERTLYGLVQTLMERGAIGPAELGSQMTALESRRHHDMGGLDGNSCAPRGHAYDEWEHRVDAIAQLLRRPGHALMTVDEMRRNIEAIGPATYDAMGYYERWAHAIAQTLLQRGVLSVAELESVMQTALRKEER